MNRRLKISHVFSGFRRSVAKVLIEKTKDLPVQLLIKSSAFGKLFQRLENMIKRCRVGDDTNAPTHHFAVHNFIFSVAFLHFGNAIAEVECFETLLLIEENDNGETGPLESFTKALSSRQRQRQIKTERGNPTIPRLLVCELALTERRKTIDELNGTP